MPFPFNFGKALVASLSMTSLAKAAPYTNVLHRSSGNYALLADYSGPSFFQNFDTYNNTDPTNGFVKYVGMQQAASSEYLGFIYNESINGSTAYIGVEKDNITPDGRSSVRLTTKQTFNVGTLVAIDVLHAPVAYGTWPAAWMLGSVGSWPQSGEIDILEWVHETPYNAMTLHTAPGCTVDNSTKFQGQLLQSNCNANYGSDGCSVDAYNQDQTGASSSSTLATAGTAFNQQGGGVYVMDWQASGITIWLFSRDSLPSDLSAGTPDPSSWTQTPLAQFAGTGCNFATAFQEMNFIFDITFCGAWAGKSEVWAQDAQNATGAATCEEYVQNNPAAFGEAYFEIASLKFYSSSGAAAQQQQKRSTFESLQGVEFKSIVR